METEDLERQLEEQLGRMGYELVSLEHGGGRRRPLLRLRIDIPGGDPGRSAVTVEDCARVSRTVREHLAARGEGEEVILEVSSPGVERPLTRRRDYERFRGERVRLRGYGPLPGGGRHVEGELVGVEEGERGDVVVLIADQGKVELPLAAVAKATLVYRVEQDL